MAVNIKTLIFSFNVSFLVLLFFLLMFTSKSIYNSNIEQMGADYLRQYNASNPNITFQFFYQNCFELDQTQDPQKIKLEKNPYLCYYRGEYNKQKFVLDFLCFWVKSENEYQCGYIDSLTIGDRYLSPSDGFGLKQEVG